MEKMHWTFFEKFQSDETIFIKRMKAAAPIWEVLNDNDLSKYSISQMTRANEMWSLIKDWWISNRERMRKQYFMSEKSWYETNKAFGCNGSMADSWRFEGEEEYE